MPNLLPLASYERGRGPVMQGDLLSPKAAESPLSNRLPSFRPTRFGIQQGRKCRRLVRTATKYACRPNCPHTSSPFVAVIFSRASISYPSSWRARGCGRDYYNHRNQPCRSRIPVNVDFLRACFSTRAFSPDSNCGYYLDSLAD
jgi:hypothetical protein